MWEAYMAHQQGSWFETPRADRRWLHPELDPIDPSTIGRFNVTTWEQYSRDYHWMEGARRLLTQGTIKELEPQPTKEELPSVRCSEDARRFLGKLAQTNEGTSLLRPFEYPDVLKETCGLFLTPKKENTFRLIFDARRANARLERLNGFRLFTLDDLIHAMGNLMAKGPVYAWTCDFRHFLYQLGLARPLQQWFGIRGFGKEEIYFPNVWPMGFHSSPEVAQCVSWTAVLAREKRRELFGSDTTKGPHAYCFTHRYQEGHSRLHLRPVGQYSGCNRRQESHGEVARAYHAKHPDPEARGQEGRGDWFREPRQPYRGRRWNFPRARRVLLLSPAWSSASGNGYPAAVTALSQIGTILLHEPMP